MRTTPTSPEEPNDSVHPSELKVNDLITIKSKSKNNSEDHENCVYSVTKPMSTAGYIIFTLVKINKADASRRVKELKPNGGYDKDFSFHYFREKSDDEVMSPKISFCRFTFPNMLS